MMKKQKKKKGACCKNRETHLATTVPAGDFAVKSLSNRSLKSRGRSTYMIQVFLHRCRHVHQVVKIHGIALQLLHGHHDAGLRTCADSRIILKVNLQLIRHAGRETHPTLASPRLPGLRVTLMSRGDTCVLLTVAFTSTLTSDCSMNSASQPLSSSFTGRSQRRLGAVPSRKS